MPHRATFTRRPPERSLGRLVCLISRRYSLLVLRRMAVLGLGQGQVLPLAELYHRRSQGQPPYSQEELAGVLRMHKGAVARAVAPLELGGFVTREPDASDRRIKRILLSAKALQAEAEFFSILYETSDNLLEGLGEAEAETLLLALRKVLANAETQLASERHPAAGDDI